MACTAQCTTEKGLAQCICPPPKPTKPTELYMHDNQLVHVLSSIKGRHEEMSLCHNNCKRHMPGKADSCALANEVHRLCQQTGLTTPVFECPDYIAKGADDA